MNDEFEQEEFEYDLGGDEISGDEPLISHNNGSQNSYGNQRRTRGNNLNQRRNSSNRNPVSRNNKAGNLNNAASSNNSGLSRGIGKNRSQAGKRKSRGFLGDNSSSDGGSDTSNNFSNRSGNIMDDGNSSSVDETEENVKFKIPLMLKVKVALGIVGVLLVAFIILFICAIFIAIFGSGVSTTKNIYTDPDNTVNYCEQIEVTFYKKIEENGTTRYEINTEVGENGVATYDFETYVAGVITGEVGVFNNEETLKAFAVAIRTYVLRNNHNCKVESSDRFQVMSPSVSSKGIRIAKETEGEVLFGNDDKLINSEYDAFACYKEDEEFYYLKQGNIIPKIWVETNFPNLNQKWTACQMLNAHGRGMSAYGALYLAEVHGYSYHEILNYYYGDKIKGFYCTYEEVEGSCDPSDPNCEPELEKVCK